MISITSSRIFASRSATRGVMSRMLFSTECEPAQRLRDILQEYRREHFSRETPNRFKTELLSPYVGSNGAVEVEQLNKLLANIDRAECRLSPEEQEILLEAAGSSDRYIELKKMIELIA